MWPQIAIELWLETVTPNRHFTHEKRALEEMDANVTPQRKTKARRINDESKSVGIFDDNDEQETPRALQEQTSSHPLNVAVHALPPHRSPSHPARQSQSQSASDFSSTGNSTGEKRKRPGSPAKKLDDQRFARYPVKMQPVVRIPDLPASMRDLILAIRQIGKGQRIFHERYMDWRERVGSGVEEEEEAMFTKGTGEGEHRDALGAIPDLEWTERRIERARRCSTHNCAEAAWNCGVHDYIMDKALEGTPYVKSVIWENITTARIHSPLLSDPTSLSKPDSKKVDFCIALELDSSEEILTSPKLSHRLFQAGIESLNHTDYTGIRYNPIAISIETKTALAGSAEATLQLSTWVTAQITFLKQMLMKVGNSGVPIPPLPLVMIVGHEWSLCCMEDRVQEAVFWTGITIGKTDSLIGTYQIIMALQYLIQWAETVYRPWFDKNILKPLLDMIQ